MGLVEISKLEEEFEKYNESAEVFKIGGDTQEGERKRSEKRF